MSEEIDDMRPSLGRILQSYQNYSYKPDLAIAEFVDNSVQSYRNNRAMLQLLYGDDFKLEISILYNSYYHALSIVDNAYGMDYKTFQNALKIAKPPQDTSGRNEYGMGLKTAASWFGQHWSVKTISPDDKVMYGATIDVDDLIRNGANGVEIERNVKSEYIKDHGTIVNIVVGDRHKITTSSMEKLKDELASLYRRDISEDRIRIEVGGQELKYTQPSIRKIDEDGIEKELKKEFDEPLIFENHAYRIKGFIAIRETGSREEAGFVLFRRGRVIIKNYRPRSIFGTGSSFEYQRLFGEIDLDMFPVTQAKDAFDWDLSGLKEAFDDMMKEISAPYVEKAQQLRYRNNPSTDLKNASSPRSSQNLNTQPQYAASKYESQFHSQTVSYVPDHGEKIDVSSAMPELNKPRFISLELSDETYNFSIICTNTRTLPGADIVYIEYEGSGTIKLEINMNYSMFKKSNYDQNLIKNVESWYMLLAICEKRGKIMSRSDGLIHPIDIRMNMNELITEICNNGDLYEKVFGGR